MADEQAEKKIDFQKLSESIQSIMVTAERGMAISGVAKLDDCLKQLLRAFFINNEKACDALLDEPGPVSTFGARIELAFVLGLISGNERNTFNLIRKIRNDFSHGSDERSFQTPPIKDRCLNLDPTPGIWKLISNSKPLDPNNPQELFLGSLRFLVAAIAYRGEALPRRQEPGSVTDEQLASLIEAEMKASERHKEKG